MDRFKQLTKNTIIITIGKVSTQCISFLLLPLYTNILSTSDYGTVDFITTIIHFLVPIISLMIEQGTFRYLIDVKKEDDEKKILSNSFAILGGLSIFLMCVYIIISLFINSTYKLWVLLILLSTVYNNLLLQIARGEKRVDLYSIGSFICSTTIIGFNVVFIAILKTGAIGMLIATFLGNLITYIFLSIKLKIFSKMSIKFIDKNTILEILKYSVPLVPNQLSLWLMNGSDKVIVTMLLGASANGILSISHKFPAIYMVFFNIFMLAWQETVTIYFNSKDREQFFSDVINKIIKLFSTACILIIIVLPLIFDLFVNEAYYESYYNIPIYMAASLFNVEIGILGAVYVANKKTIEIVKTTLLAGIINIITNLIFIKFIGLYAAAVSTFIGYLIAMIYRIIDTRKYLKIKYNLNTYVIAFIGLILSIIIYYINNKLLSIMTIPIFIICLFIFNKDTLSIFISYILQFKRRKITSEEKNN